MKRLLFTLTLMCALLRAQAQLDTPRYTVYFDKFGIQHTSMVPTKLLAITGDLNDAVIKFSSLAASGITDVYTKTQGDARYAPLTGSSSYVSVGRTLTINGVALDLSADRSWTISTSAPVSSVFGRTGAITASNGDYTTSQVTEGSNLYWTTARGDARYPLLTGSYVNPSWLTSIPYSKITATPITLSGYGITDGVTTTSLTSTLSGYATTSSLSAYTTNTSLATQLSGYASLSGSYSNPSWISSLDYGKLINVPAASVISSNTLSKSANYTISSTDFANGKSANLTIRVNCASGAVTITLPSALNGYSVTVIKTDNSNNLCTISGLTGDNLLASQYQSRTGVADASTWNNN